MDFDNAVNEIKSKLDTNKAELEQKNAELEKKKIIEKHYIIWLLIMQIFCKMKSDV